MEFSMNRKPWWTVTMSILSVVTLAIMSYLLYQTIQEQKQFSKRMDFSKEVIAQFKNYNETADVWSLEVDDLKPNDEDYYERARKLLEIYEVIHEAELLLSEFMTSDADWSSDTNEAKQTLRQIEDILKQAKTMLKNLREI